MSGLLIVAAVPSVVGGLIAAARLRRLRDAVNDCVHELSRPLTALAIGLEAPLPVDPLVLAGEVERAGSSLATLRAEIAGRSSTTAQAFDLGELAEEIAAAWASVAERSARRLTIERLDRSPVIADRGQVGQAACNLVANAIEHGEGPICLKVVSSGGGSRLEVSDSGRGMDRRAVRPGTRGRGLSIARRLAAQAGGSLRGPEEMSAGTWAIELNSRDDGVAV
jgi:signal transduction histidine kinase